MAFTFAGLYADQQTDRHGRTLRLHAVTVYEADGVTLATLYTDRTKATTLANPVTTDNAGNLTFYAEPGTYQLLAAGATAMELVTVGIDPAAADNDATVNTDGLDGRRIFVGETSPEVAYSPVGGDVWIAPGGYVTVWETTPFDPLSIDWHAVLWTEGPLFEALALADGGVVTTWPDESGNGWNATQATAGFKPIYRASVASLGGKPGIDFDGVDDFLATASFGSFSQPTDIVIIGEFDVLNASSSALVDGIAVNIRHLVSAAATTNLLSMHAGVTITSTEPIATQPFIMVAKFASVLTTLRVNGIEVLSGSSAGSNPLTGLTIGGNYLGTNNGDSTIAFVGVKVGGLSTAERDALEAWA